MTARVNKLFIHHKGIINYIKLIEKGLIKPPKVELSVNAAESFDAAKAMSVGVYRWRITVPAKFNTDTNKWKSHIYSGEFQEREL